jgi:recombination protein RecA
VKNFVYVNIFSFKLDFWIRLLIFVSNLKLNKRQIMAGKAEIQKKADNKVANDKNLNLAISGINKQFGPGALMKLGDATKMEVDKISTGSIAIDLALGIGGLPKGRVCEIYGPESSGKTTFCLSIIAEAQKQGGNAVFIDVEHALDPKYAKIVGVDLENLMVSQPECGEDALNITETLIRSGAIDIIVVDSVAALVSKNELDGQMGDSTVGLQARMMSQAMRRLTGAINKTQCVVLFTNQIREKIGVMFGSPETQPGGRALKFFSSVRMDIRRIGQIKETSGKVIGNRTRLKVVKNKVAPPFTDCEFDIMYNEGISHSGSLVDLGVEHKILEKKGSWISFKGEMVGQGREAAKQAIINDPKLGEELTGLILDKVHPKVGESIASSSDEDAS